MKLARIFAFGVAGALALLSDAKALENKTTVTSSVPMAPDSIDKASESELANFRSNPKSLLTSNPIGGLELASMVKALALGDSNSVESLIALSAWANPLQLAAIGTGLGQAAKILENSSNEDDRQAADIFQSKIDAAKSEALLNSFKSGLNGIAVPYGKANVQWDSSDASTGVAGGGVGGAVNQNPGNALPQGSSTLKTFSGGSKSTTNITESIPFSGVGVTCTSSVSPSRVC